MSDRPRVDPGSQSRSRATFERIVEASRDLLDGRDWATVTIEDVCLAAEVSPSSFYSRFRSKDDLLDVVHQRWIDERSQTLQTIVEHFPWHLPPREVCRLIAIGYLNDRLEHADRAFSMMRVQAGSPHLAARKVAADKRDLECMAAPLARAVGCSYEDACFGLVAISSTLIALVQPPASWLEVLDWSADDVADRCVAAFAAIVDVDLDAERPAATP